MMILRTLLSWPHTLPPNSRGPRCGTRAQARVRGVVNLSVVVALLVGVLLLAAGVGLRVAGRNGGGNFPKTPMRKSFDDFPRDFLGYQWQRGKLDEATEVTAGADAYLKLDGLRTGDAAQVDLYATYVGGGQTLLEHEPQVCYGAQAWTLPFGIAQSEIEIPARAGRAAWSLPINIYLFERDFSYILVVNYYCVNWKYSSNRTEMRLMGDHPGGFYLQTRVTLGVTEADLAGCTSANFVQVFTKNARYRQAVEVLRFAAPLLEDYLPPRSPAEEASPASRSGS